MEERSELLTQDTTLPDGADQQVDGADGGQVSEKEYGETTGGANDVAADVGSRAALEAKADLQVLVLAGWLRPGRGAGRSEWGIGHGGCAVEEHRGGPD
jgi:hypothetical protein